MMFFVTIKNTITKTIITKPIYADTIEKAKDTALNLIGKDEVIVLLTMGI